MHKLRDLSGICGLDVCIVRCLHTLWNESHVPNISHTFDRLCQKPSLNIPEYSTSYQRDPCRSILHMPICSMIYQVLHRIFVHSLAPSCATLWQFTNHLCWKASHRTKGSVMGRILWEAPTKNKDELNGYKWAIYIHLYHSYVAHYQRRSCDTMAGQDWLLLSTKAGILRR